MFNRPCYRNVNGGHFKYGTCPGFPPGTSLRRRRYKSQPGVSGPKRRRRDVRATPGVRYPNPYAEGVAQLGSGQVAISGPSPAASDVQHLRCNQISRTSTQGARLRRNGWALLWNRFAVWLATNGRALTPPTEKRIDPSVVKTYGPPRLKTSTLQPHVWNLV